MKSLLTQSKGSDTTIVDVLHIRGCTNVRIAIVDYAVIHVDLLCQVTYRANPDTFTLIVKLILRSALTVAADFCSPDAV